MRVLIVDDSDKVRLILSTILLSLDFEVAEAADGAEALTYLKDHATDAITTDFNMPGMDGLTFVERARETAHGKDIPIFVLSSEDSPRKLARGVRCGVTGWMKKPMSPPLVAAALLQAVS